MRPFVYGLFDPMTPEQIRYVGMAYANPARPYVHARAACRASTKPHPLIHWIRTLMAEGRHYDVYVFEELDEGSSREFVYEVEHLYIEGLRRLGHALLNLNDGGPGAAPGPEGRARLSARMLGNTQRAGKPKSSLEIERQRESLLRYYQEHPEAREQISRRFLGNTYAVGRVFSPAALKAIGAAHVGKQHALGAIHSDAANRAKSEGLLRYNSDPSTADDRARQHAKQAESIAATYARKKLEDPEEEALRAARISASVKESWARRRAATTQNIVP